MADLLVPALVVGGAGAIYIATKKTPAPLPGTPKQGAGATPGATKGQLIQQSDAQKAVAARIASRYRGAFVSPRNLGGYGGANSHITGGGGNWGSTVDAQTKQKLDLMEQYAKAQFDNMDEIARQKAADNLNYALKLDPPLNGHENWETIASVTGAAVGAAAGAWIGGPLGAKVGALVGAYLGVKAEEWISKNYDDLKSWAGDKWGDIKGWVVDTSKDVVNKVEDVAGDVVDYVGGWF